MTPDRNLNPCKISKSAGEGNCITIKDNINALFLLLLSDLKVI